MPALLDHPLSQPFIGLRNQYMTVGMPKLQIHPNILHIKPRSLKPMHQHNKPSPLSRRFAQQLHIPTGKPDLRAMLLHTAELEFLAFLFEYLFYFLVVAH